MGGFFAFTHLLSMVACKPDIWRAKTGTNGHCECCFMSDIRYRLENPKRSFARGGFKTSGWVQVPIQYLIAL